MEQTPLSDRAQVAADAVRILTTARSKIENPKRWTRRVYKSGNKYCALGALGSAMGQSGSANPRPHTDPEIAAYRALHRAVPYGGGVAGYNDDEADHQGILNLYDRAIESECKIVRKEGREISPQEPPPRKGTVKGWLRALIGIKDSAQ